MFSFPDVSEFGDCVQDESSFVICEPTVLAEGVKADDEFLLSAGIWCKWEFRPFTGFLVEVFTTSDGCGFTLVLF